MKYLNSFFNGILAILPKSIRGNLLNVFIVLVAKIVGVGFTFVFSVFLARLLGATGVGTYFIALTIVSIGSAIARLGLDNVVLRFASVSFGQGDVGNLMALYRRCMGLVIGAGLVVVAFIYGGVVYWQTGMNQTDENINILFVMLFSVVPVALIMLQGEFFKAIDSPVVATIVQSVMLPLLLVLGVAVFYWQGSVSLKGVSYLYVIGAVISFLFAGMLWLRFVPSHWLGQEKFDTRILLRTSLPLFFVTSMHMIMSWTDILVLGYFTDSSTVGVYGVVARVATLTAFIMMAANSVIVPKFAVFYERNDKLSMERLAQRSAFWMLLATSPVIFFLLFYPQVILRLFGEEFLSGDLLLQILVVGQLVNVAMGAVVYMLIMSGNEKIVRNILFISALLNIVGNLVLVPVLGAIGACISTAFSLVVLNFLSYYLVIKKLKINTLGYLFGGGHLCSSR